MQTHTPAWRLDPKMRGRARLNCPAPTAQPFESRAFTLLELIAVLVVLSFLAAILAPAFASLGPNTRSGQCLHHLRLLGMSWRMYAEDNAGRLAPNADGGYTGRASYTASWAGGWLDYTARTDNTNTDLLVNHQLWPYSAYFGAYLKNPAVFKCPADTSVISIAGQSLPRVRSYSMNGHVGEISRTWSGSANFLLYRNVTEIINPAPANLMVILDERQDSINDGAFMVDAGTPWGLADYPGGYHNGGGNFVFADGHSETHIWQDPRTVPLLRPGQVLPIGISLTNDMDLVWIKQHATANK